MAEVTKTALGCQWFFMVPWIRHSWVLFFLFDFRSLLEFYFFSILDPASVPRNKKFLLDEE